jgi:hypothetical protein
MVKRKGITWASSSRATAPVARAERELGLVASDTAAWARCFST